MEIALLIYFAQVLDSFRNVLALCAVCGILVLSFFLPFFMDNPPVLVRFVKRTLITYTVIAICLMFTPSSKTLYMMAGGYAAQTVVQSEISGKILKLLEQKLNEELEKLKK